MNLLCRIFLTMTLLLSAACEDRENQTVRPNGKAVQQEDGREVNSFPIGSDGDDDTVSFLRTETDTTADQPTLCLVFSKPLDPSISYEPYLSLKEKVASRASGQRLCIEGLNYGSTSVLTLRSGLPAADGSELLRDEQVTLTFTDRPPVVQFAGNGVILPRTDGHGIPIMTVNVPSVNVRITRLNDRALVFKRVTEGFSVSAGDYQYSPYNEIPGDLGSLVYQGILETPGEKNSVSHTALPISEAVGELENGAYYVEIEDARAKKQNQRQPARAARWVLVTDLAMTAYKGTSGLDITLRSLQTAKPERNATVKLLAQSNEVLAEAKADRTGRVRFAAPLLRGQGGDRAKMLIAETEQDFAILDLDRAPLDLSSQPVAGLPPIKGAQAFMYLDRGVYRPGETVFITGLVRDEQGSAVKQRAGTLTVYRPNGTEQVRQRFDELPLAGALSMPFVLPKAASRGVWRAAIELDGLGVIGSTRFNVEDFVPQRLKLTLEADTETAMVRGEKRAIRTDLQFLYGAPGSGLKLSGEARIESDPSPFADLQGFHFGLATKPFRPTLIYFKPTVSDGAGKATLVLNPGNTTDDIVAPLRLRTVVCAEEPGGRIVADDIIVPYRPQQTYLGLKSAFEGSVESGKPASFLVAARDRKGEPRAEEISWRLRRRDYNYDWYQNSAGKWRWRRSEQIIPITEGVLSTSTEDGKDGRAEIELPALPWGDYELVASLTGVDRVSQSFWVGYGGRSADGTPAPDSVRLLTTEMPAKTNDKITIAVQPPYPGLAEVAIARDGVIDIKHIVIPEGGTEITLKVTEEWGSGAYVLVSVFTDREPRRQPIPKRAMGAIYIPADTSTQVYQPELSVKSVIRPQSKAAIQLTVPDVPVDTDLYATLAAVDEGILLLTKHQAPEPEVTIFDQRALGTEIYDDYGRLLDANLAETGVLRSGGDAIGGASLTAVPIKTVALFDGPKKLGRNNTIQFDVDIPQFNGALRLMAVVWSKDGVGSVSTQVTVRDDVSTELILPRFLAPGDEAVATLSIDNIAGADGVYQSTVSSKDSLLSTTGSEQIVELTKGTRRDVPVTINAEEEGVTTLRLMTRGPNAFVAESTYSFEVRTAFLPEIRTNRILLRSGESYSPDPQAFEDFVPGSGEILISAASTPIDRTPLLKSMDNYPYACTEQLVSQGFSLLSQATRTADQTAKLQSSIDTILQRQNADGAFGMWRVGDRRANPWLGAYTSDFLARARSQGFVIPEDSMKRAYAALQPISQGKPERSYGYDSRSSVSRYSDDTAQRLQARAGAYALYVLTRANLVDRARLRYVHDAALEKIESPLAKAHIGASLSRLGDRGRAKSAFQAAQAALGYENNGDWYQTPLRDAAAISELLAEAGRVEDASQLLTETFKSVPDATQLTTQERAFLIRSAYVLSGEQDDAFVTYKGYKTQSEILAADADFSQAFENDSDDPVFLTVQTIGAPRSAPPQQASDLSITKQIFHLNGEAAEFDTVQQGERFIIRLGLTPERQARSQYVITDLLPAGLEIEAVMKPRDGGPNGLYAFLGGLASPDIAEARDDRFVVSQIFGGTDERVYAYIVRAVTPGTFTAPGAYAEDMYRHDVFARNNSSTLRIKP